jgi:hypothetical protein
VVVIPPAGLAELPVYRKTLSAPERNRLFAPLSNVYLSTTKPSYPERAASCSAEALPQRIFRLRAAETLNLLSR